MQEETQGMLDKHATVYQKQRTTQRGLLPDVSGKKDGRQRPVINLTEPISRNRTLHDERHSHAVRPHKAADWTAKIDL